MLLFVLLITSLLTGIEPALRSMIGRSHTIGAIEQRTNVVRQSPRSSSSSAASSSSLITPEGMGKKKPVLIPESSATKERTGLRTCDGSCAFKDINLRPEPAVMEEAQRARNVLDLGLREVSEGTNNRHLDPTRDGVFARFRNVLRRHGPATVFGAAAGVAGYEISNDLIKHFNESTTKIPTTTSTTTEYEEIVNALSD